MAEQNTAAIYDLGYQRYTGPRYGRLYGIRTLLTFSFRSAFGLGRGDKSKTMPVIVVVLVYLPAFARVLLASTVGMPNLIQYASFFEYTAVLVALFAAAQAPELIVTDKQHGVLSLYLSHPVLAVDYAIAKIGAMVGALLVLTLGPQLVLFAGKIAIAADPGIALKAEWTKLFPIIGGTLLTSLFVGSVALLLASFTSRRGYGTAAVIVFFLMLPPVVDMFRSVTSGDIKRYALLLHPVYLIMGYANWLFDVEAKRHTQVGRADLPGPVYMWTLLAACALCITLLLRRYRRTVA